MSNKIITFLTIVFIAGCSPRTLVILDKKNCDVLPIKIAVLDFYNHSNTSNPRLGRELAERLSYDIFAHSKGTIEIVERNHIKSTLQKLGSRFGDTFSKKDLITLADSTNVDFIVKGVIIDYSKDLMEKKNNTLEVLLSLISSKDGSTVAMLRIKEETENPQTLIESVSFEAGKRIVREKVKLYHLLKPVVSDTLDAH